MREKKGESTVKVLNFGSLNYDYVYQVDHMARAGETICSAGMERYFGGKGLNQSIALARAGVPVYHAGMIGEDGDAFLELCRENKVDTSYIRTVQGKSGHTIIQVDKSAQNCILLYGGTNRRITEEYIDTVLKDFEKGDILLLQNEINLLDAIIDRAYEKGMTIILNPSPFDAALDICDLKKVSVFLINEVEGEQMTGEREPEGILSFMRREYPEAQVVLTLGSAGSVWQYKEERCEQGIIKVDAVDTTAAGDTFTGYFVAGMLEGKSVPDILLQCAKASAITESRKGAAPSIPYKEELQRELY